MKWTGEQLKAIETINSGIVVSAAAGSGKTAVLVERIIRLLADKTKNIPADTLVAVTFTNDAAAQMREKIAIALDKKISENPDDEWLLLQQVKLSAAKITTINAFCFDLVKSNADKFDIQSGVQIIDEKELTILQDKALDTAFEIMCNEKREEFIKIYNCLCKKNDKELRTAVLKLSNFKRTLPFPDTWVKKCRENYLSDAFAEKIKDIIKQASQIHKDKAEMYFNSMAEQFAIMKGLRFSGSSGLFNYEDFSDIFAGNSGSKSLDGLANLLAVDKEILDGVENNTEIKHKTFSKASYLKELTDYTQNIDAIESFRKKFKDEIKELREAANNVFSNVREDNALTHEMFTVLNEIADLYDSELWELKLERNAIEFSDNEIMSVQLLAKETSDGFEPSDYANSIVKDGAYNLLLMDEYQDVNNLQNVIFKCLSRNATAEKIGENEFVVGDVKQAIYRFRLTNPRIMMQTRENAGSCNDGSVTEILLSNNFRSRKNVVDFANTVFSILMSKQCGEVDYNESERLKYSALYSDRKENTEIIVSDEMLHDEIPSEYLAAATRIMQLLKERVLVFDDGVERECRPSDFCILARTNDQCQFAANALKLCGLKASVETTGAYLKSNEVSVIINLLKIINLPTNDIAMASVLLSPIFMLTEEELAQLRLLNLSGSMNLYMIMLNISNPSERSGEAFIAMSETLLGEKIRDIVDKIKRLRVYSSCMTVEKLIAKIFELTDYFSIASTFEDAKQKRANLRLLQYYAYSYEKSSGSGLEGFIRYINSVCEKGNDLSQAVALEEDVTAVGVKTIHKSKGLEYPFVFLSGLSGNINTDNKAQILINEDLGLSMKIRDTKNRLLIVPELFSAMMSINKIETMSETMRLLYVAMTRAKEKLFICISNDKNLKNDLETALEVAKSGAAPSFIRDCKNMRQWILCALMFFKSRDSSLLCCDEIPIIDEETELSFNFITNKYEFEESELEEDTSEYDKEAIQKMAEIMSRSYDYSECKTLSKLTVTEIAKGESSDDIFYPQLPSFSESFSRISAAEKGTAAHMFMQYADFSKAALSIENEVADVVARGAMSQKQADCLSVETLEGFFMSNIYKRLAKSDNVMREKKFFVKISDLAIDNDIIRVYNGTDGMLQGVADCIFEEDDGYVLIDYKTDNTTSEQALLDRYATQLRLYAAAFNILLDKPVKEAYIYSFVQKKVIEAKI